MKTRSRMLSGFLALLVITSLVFVSCSDDDSPADSDIFIGKYEGTVSYTNGESSTIETDGWVEVVKVGNNYNFIFSNDIPEITGVEFVSNGEVLLSVGANETYYIRVTAHTLDIEYLENGNDFWTAHCTR